jgi:hypothetical protein
MDSIAMTIPMTTPIAMRNICRLPPGSWCHGAPPPGEPADRRDAPRPRLDRPVAAPLAGVGSVASVKPVERLVARVQDWLFMHREYVPDRRVLEDVILPALLERADVQRVLFVGCAWYTRRYVPAFAGRELWTLDVDPEQARYGAPRHVVDSLANLGTHVAPGRLDAIVCNGVIGYGLDDPADIETAVAACFDALRGGGLLVLGVDDSAPVAVADIAALARFAPVAPPPFPASRYPTFSATGHTFHFHARPA